MRGLLGVAVMLSLGGVAHAQSVPARINHQGRLFNSLMQPVMGAQMITFSIYAGATGGTPGSPASAMATGNRTRWPVW